MGYGILKERDGMGWDGMACIWIVTIRVSVNLHQDMFTAGYIKGLLLFRNSRVPCSDWVGNYRLPMRRKYLCVLPVCADAQNRRIFTRSRR